MPSRFHKYSSPPQTAKQSPAADRPEAHSPSETTAPAVPLPPDQDQQSHPPPTREDLPPPTLSPRAPRDQQSHWPQSAAAKPQTVPRATRTDADSPAPYEIPPRSNPQPHRDPQHAAR